MYLQTEGMTHLGVGIPADRGYVHVVGVSADRGYVHVAGGGVSADRGYDTWWVWVYLQTESMYTL